MKTPLTETERDEMRREEKHRRRRCPVCLAIGTHIANCPEDEGEEEEEE